ncbi:NAD-dependent epimerase/dehydratase family protein [Microbacterium sp. AZCO]|uniref:NAD-dependent epimerase/dehydratase family protein n=1 Tax=Microbacterium sp. AZCO TaxID=3142976 RepID=UPI0031F43F5F
MGRELPVLVTGATGFVAGHVIAELLRAGHDVRATVRDPARAELGYLRAIAAETDRRFDVVGATLDADDGWAAAVDGVDAVLHVASPAPKSRPRNPQDVIRPAVEGTRRVVGAAAAAGVRRVVLTSSTSAVVGGHDRRDGRVRTEDDWSDVGRCDPYDSSKTLAEREAWRLAEESGLDLVAVCPGLILGPLQRRGTNVSMDVLDQLLSRSVPALPRIGFAIVDVRDVAVAHRLALERPEASGRYILSAESAWLVELARILDAAFRARGYRVPLAQLPSWVIRAGSPLNPSLKLALPLLDQPVLVSSARVQDELGWTTRALPETVVDAGESLVEFGYGRRR